MKRVFIRNTTTQVLTQAKPRLGVCVTLGKGCPPNTGPVFSRAGADGVFEVIASDDAGAVV